MTDPEPVPTADPEPVPRADPGPVPAADPGPVPVAEFDRATVAAATAALRPCCAATRWASQLVAGRPYRTLGALGAASDTAIAALDWPDIEEALAAHPRIGDRPDGPGREAAWSRREQAGTSAAGPGARAALRSATGEYEARFGHVFLICATGLRVSDMLIALHGRLGHDPAAEREAVRDELRKITALRLGKTFR
ncbi:MAG: 2-oxo-4-hydroxy-4-carboxy-5-ureidoimidazoline decarboxylase [Streptosporangiaceae bacterium]